MVPQPRATSRSLRLTWKQCTVGTGSPAGKACGGFYAVRPSSIRLRRNDTMRIAVIGSGLGGLAAACTLAARGYQVEVFEKNPWLGGKAAVLEEQGFRFD